MRNPPHAPVACPTCGAGPGVRCRTGTGRYPPQVHRARARAVDEWFDAQGPGGDVVDLSAYRARRRAASQPRIDTPS